MIDAAGAVGGKAKRARRASAISSPVILAGSEAGTTSRSGEEDTSTMGTKSFTGW
jgi:hypothetical protein